MLFRSALLVGSDDPIALAAAIREVYWGTAAAARRASAARLRLEHEYAVGPWLDRYETVYRLVSAQVSVPRTAA